MPSRRVAKASAALQELEAAATTIVPQDHAQRRKIRMTPEALEESEERPVVEPHPSSTVKRKSESTIKGSDAALETVSNGDGGGAAAAKRRKDPGVRVIGGRIYDSENGKTCHQCRQKTIDYMAACKSTARAKPCTQNYCAKCLLNRYGELAAEVAQFEAWTCPKCRGVCNCSICMKKQGRSPTGILSPTAKATGFSSVAELLKKQPAIKAEDVRKESPNIKSPQASSALASLTNKQLSKGQKGIVASKPERTKPENGSNQENSKGVKKASLKATAKSADGATLTQNGHTGVKKECADTGPLDAAHERGCTAADKTSCNSSKPQKPSAKKRKIIVSENGHLGGPVDAFAALLKSAKQKSTSKGNNKGEVKKEPTEDQVDGDGSMPKKARKKKPETVFGDGVPGLVDGKSNGSVEDGAIGSHLLQKQKKERKKKKDGGKQGTVTEEGSKPAELEGSQAENKGHKKVTKKLVKQEVQEEDEIVLPPGESLLTVAGLELPPHAVGPALQLVEFCSAFGRALALKNGDVEALMREFSKGRVARRGPNSPLIQLHVKLLNMLEDGLPEPVNVSHFSSGKSSWLQVLKRHLTEKSCMFMHWGRDKSDSISPAVRTVTEEDLKTIKEAIAEGAEGYEKLEMHHKLQLLVILCDDCLETECLREFIDSANREFCEVLKENREEVLAAKKEERDARNRIRDAEVARLLAAENINGPISTEQKDALLAQVQAETQRAAAAATLVKNVASKMPKNRSDAVRTDAITSAEDGRVLFKLKGALDRTVVVLQDISNMVPSQSLDRWAMYSEADEAVLDSYLIACRAKALRKRSGEASKQLSSGGDRGVEDEDEKVVERPDGEGLTVEINIEGCD